MDGVVDSQAGFAQGASGDEFDTDGAALYIGCTPGHLRNLRLTGDGPPFERLFRRKGIRYHRSDIDEWRSKRRFGSTTEYPENLG